MTIKTLEAKAKRAEEKLRQSEADNATLKKDNTKIQELLENKREKNLEILQLKKEIEAGKGAHK
jgi:hypothetical protein